MDSENFRYLNFHCYIILTNHGLNLDSISDSLSVEIKKILLIVNGYLLVLIFREAFFDYAKHTKILLETLYRLLSEALGLNSSYLIDIECNRGQMILFHYYPPCPEPEVAMGTTQHSDTGFLTLLLQDDIGGLQVLHDDQWIDVPPMPGAFIVNIGDLMQVHTHI
jgi:isopenicillin N synthase-like dioxygenase